MTEDTPTLGVPAAAPPSWARRYRAGLLALSLALALAIGLTWWLRGGGDMRADLLRLPKGLPMALTLDFQRVLALEVLASALSSAPVQASLAEAKKQVGVDVLSLGTWTMGLRVQDGAVGLISVLHGRFEVETLRATLAKIPGVVSSTLGGLPASTMTLGQPVDELVARLMPGSETPVVDGVPLPVIPDLHFQVRDDRTLLVGTRDLLDAWLEGGATLAEDAELVAILDQEVSTDALGYGVGRWEENSPTARAFQALQAALLPQLGLPKMADWPNSVAVFDFTVEDKRIAQRLLYRLMDEAAATRLEAYLKASHEASQKVTDAVMPMDYSVTRDGNDLRLKIGFSIPGL